MAQRSVLSIQSFNSAVEIEQSPRTRRNFGYDTGHGFRFHRAPPYEPRQVTVVDAGTRKGSRCVAQGPARAPFGKHRQAAVAPPSKLLAIGWEPSGPFR